MIGLTVTVSFDCFYKAATKLLVNAILISLYQRLLAAFGQVFTITISTIITARIEVDA